MNIESIIYSQEYKVKLSEHLTSLLKRTKSSTTEADTAFAFESEIYVFVRNLFNIHPDFKKEVGQGNLRHKFIGRIDAVCNNLIIEYKKIGKLDNERDKIKATNQLKNYLLQLLEQDGNEYHGVLTDGIKIRYIYFQNGVIHETSFKNIDETDLDKIVQSIIDLKNKKFVPKNIVFDFKLNSQNAVTSELANYLFKALINNKSDKTSMLFQEWEVLFHLSENDKGQNDDINKRRKALGKLLGIKIIDSETDYKALFALQTTYAIIVKLIACKVVTKIEFNKNIEYFSDLSKIDFDTLREFIQYIEDGYVFQTGGIRNLLEGDFFSWYCLEEIWSDEEAQIILKLINILEGYSINFYRHGYGTIDIFIDLYMEIMPPEVRHSLGEYFTPSWLADYVVKQSKDLVQNKNFNAIDPCCGSGVFVMALIRNIIEDKDIISLTPDEKNNLLNQILERVKGVDINPLSVLTAKVCFYISVKPLINGDDIEIPIYLGDSANIPNKYLVGKTLCYEYIVNTKQENIKVLLPSSFVEGKHFFSLMSQIQSIVKTEDEELVYEKFIQNFSPTEINEVIEENIKNLSSQLVRLHKNNWDGIWIRIVSNFMLVARINNIDIIVGNPPWIKWEFLPQAYAEKIKSLCVDRHLFSGQTYMGAISLNICALIANVTASTWLNENGVLAFLMPQTLLTQDSYAGFRNFYTSVDANRRMYLQQLDDWTKSGNPFVDTQEKFMTYYYSNKVIDYFEEGIPITVLQKKRGILLADINSKQTFNEVEHLFEKYSAKAFQMDRDRTGYTTLSESSLQDKANFDLIIGECFYKARSGVEFTPAEIYFIEPKNAVKSKSSYMFQPSEFKNAKHKAVSRLPVQLETKFIKPVIKAPLIEPFRIIENNNYCIFPYEENESKSINPDQLLLESKNLYKYFTSNQKLIGKQSKRSLTISRGTAFYSLSKVGSYTFAPYKVTFRDNTKLAASVVTEIMTPWGEKLMPICAKHCPYISQDKKGNNITEEEAYFLCGILNTPIVQMYFKFTYSTRSFSINFNIKMPKYNNENKFHKQIVKLAKEATKNKPTDKIYKQLQENYLSLCREI
ncbi:Eco57I restriction-modification methylase domain-containing protein [Chryseobacterium mucoviscidosis]|uniref:Eco57I restriction-modification methylase domain-containing protein n=1 Tax=Chryseobacterium mucoviscidosis TaxID=1945581 RepID=UPI00301AD945